MTQVTCKNCKNNISNWMTRTFASSVWWRCGLENNYKAKEVNPVDGETTGGYYHSCGVARSKHGACGIEGKHWTPRSKQDLFVFLKRQ